MKESHPSSRPFAVELALPVKTYDVDFAGVVSNIVYIRWLEDLRLQIMKEHFPLEDQLSDHQSPVLAKTEITYHRPLRLFDQADSLLTGLIDLQQLELQTVTGQRVHLLVDLQQRRCLGHAGQRLHGVERDVRGHGERRRRTQRERDGDADVGVRIVHAAAEHLAAAAGIPLVVLSGADNPGETSPSRSAHRRPGGCS